MHLPVALLLALSMATPAGEPPRDPAARAEQLFNQALGSDPTALTHRVDLLAEAIRLVPGEARYRVALGDLYAAPVGDQQPAPADLAKARQIYLQAAQAAPTSPLPHLRLAELDWKDNPAAAAAALDTAIPLDPENAFPVYLRALLSFQAKEDARGRELVMAARGRKAMRYPFLMPTEALPLLSAISCIAVQSAQFFPQFSHLRELARQIVRAAGSGPDAPELLIEGQRMAYRVTSAEPRTLISLLVGVACDALVSKPLEGVLMERGDTTSMARLAQLDARRKALDAMRLKAHEAAAQMTERLPAMAANPTLRIRLWRDEGEIVTKLLAESGLKETILEQP